MQPTFYCDESGYTGTDWANPDQPVFIHGGWLIPDADAVVHIIKEMDEIRRRYRLRAPELKSGQLLRRHNSSGIFREFFSLGLRHGALPFFQVADKDYLIAAKTVETYFDPAYNHLLPFVFTANAGRKKKIAEGLLHDPALLRRFAELLRAGTRPSESEVRQIGRDLASCLRSAGQATAASWLPEFSAEGIRDIQLEFDAAAWARTTTGHTLWTVLQQLELFLRKQGMTTEVVHDNIVRFDDLLDVIRSMFRPAEKTPIRLLDGRSLPDAFSMITSLELADSKDEPIIQLADILCAHLRIIFTKLKSKIPLSEDERKTAFDLYILMLHLSTWDWNVPIALQQSFAIEIGDRATKTGSATRLPD